MKRIEYYRDHPDVDPDLRELVALVDEMFEYSTNVRVARVMASMVRILDQRFNTTGAGWDSPLAAQGRGVKV